MVLLFSFVCGAENKTSLPEQTKSITSILAKNNKSVTESRKYRKKKTFSRKPSFLMQKQKPLMLLWLVSHQRNTDKIALIFRQKSVELVTNSSSYQKKSREARLGRFRAPLNPQLQTAQRNGEPILHSVEKNSTFVFIN